MDPAGGNLSSVRVESIPANGTLELFNSSTFDWESVSVGQVVTASDIDNGYFRYAPDTHAPTGSSDGSNEGNFSFSVSDGTLNSSSVTMQVNVTPVADMPTITGGTPGTSVFDNNGNIQLPSSTGFNRKIYNNAPIKSGAATADEISDSDTASFEDALNNASANVIDTVNDVFADNEGSDQSAPLSADGAVSYTGWIFLEAGHTYQFTGYVDDAMHIELGGTTLYSQGGNVHGNFPDSARPSAVFTPSVSGYYSFEAYVYNHGGPGDIDLNLSVDGQPAQDLNTSNFDIYTDVPADVANGTASGIGSYVPVAGDAPDSDDGGYYPVINTGNEGEFIQLDGVSASFVDNDGSEVHTLTLDNIPLGAILTDGTNVFVATAGNTSANILGWDYDNLQIKAAIDNDFDTVTLTLTATAVEQSNNDTSQKAVDIDVYIRGAEVNATNNSYTVDEDNSVAGNIVTDGPIADSDASPSVGAVKSGAVLNYRAVDDTDGDSQWENTGTGTASSGTLNWGLTGQTRESVTSEYEGITEAYRFTNGQAKVVSTSFTNINSSDATDVTNKDATFEMWFKAGSSNAAGNYTLLFESGGATDGISLVLEGSNLYFIVEDSDSGGANRRQVALKYDLSELGIDPKAEFVQVAGVFDLGAPDGEGQIRLYVNGTLVAQDATPVSLLDWAGPNESSLGRIDGSTSSSADDDDIVIDGTSFNIPTLNAFEGDIAEFRYYEEALSNSEVLGNFQAVAGLAVTHVNGQPVSALVPIDTGNGTLLIAADGSYKFTPDPDFSGTETFTYTLSDPDANTDTATVTINVSPVDDNPVAFAQAVNASVDDTLTAQVPSATDVDGDLDENGYVLSQPLPSGKGILAFNSDGSYTFDPGSDFDGLVLGTSEDVTFSYVATDDNGNTSDPVQVTITVINTAGDALPVVQNVSDINYVEGSGVQKLLQGVQISDSDSTNLSSVVIELGGYDPASETLSYFTPGTSVSGSISIVNDVWTLTLTGGASIAEYLTVLESVTYSSHSQSPDTGTRTLKVTVFDETHTALSASDQSNFQISDVNSAPDAVDSVAAMPQNTVNQPLVIPAPTDIDDVVSSLVVIIDSVPTGLGTIALPDGTAVTAGTILTVDQLTSLTLSSSVNAGTGILSYTVQDDSGASDSASVTITVGDAGVDTATVYESSLNNGTLSDGGSTVATGNLLANDGAAGSDAQLTQLSFGGTAAGSLGSTIQINTDYGQLTVYTTDSTPGFQKGDYVYQLSDRVNNAPGEDVFTESINYQFTSGGNTYGSSLDVSIEDDEPIAVNVVETAPESAEEIFNVVFTFDVSTSMKNASGLPGLDRLDLAKSAYKSLAREYFEQSTQVEITVIVFADGAYEEGTYTDFDQLSAAIDGVDFADVNSRVNDGTSYYDATEQITDTLQSDLNQQQSTGADKKNIVYFMSDGNNNRDTGVFNSSDYDDFVNNNDIYSYAVGIGTGITNFSGLNFVHNIDAYGQGNGHIDPALVVTDLQELEEVLISTVPTAFGGTVVSEGGIVNSVLGADDGYVQSITVELSGNPVTFTYDGSTVTPPSSGTYNINASVLELNEGIGFPYGTMLFDFSDGTYKFFAKAGTAGQQVNVDFTLIDGDGDTANDVLRLDIIEAVPRADDDLHTINAGQIAQGNVITGLGTDGGITLGSSFTDFAIQGGGVDSAVDNADISRFSLGGLSVDFKNLQVTGSESGYSVSGLSEETVKGVVVRQVTITHGASGASLTFRSNGYYSYNPGSLMIPLVLTYVLTDQDGDEDSAVLTVRTIENTVSGDDTDQTFNGTSQNDAINGEGGNDIINGNAGYDNLSGGSGEDQLYGGNDDDRLAGGDDDDQLFGQAGADVLKGDRGNDILDGGAGDDQLFGGEGDDRLFGYTGDDVLHGGDGDDQLDGGAGNDILKGDSGQDLLIGNVGDDILEGGEQSDTFIFRFQDMLDGQTVQTDSILDFTLGDPDASDADWLDISDLVTFDNSEALDLATLTGKGVSASYDGGSNQAVITFTADTEDSTNDTLNIQFNNTTGWQNQNSDSALDGDDILLQLITNGQIIV
ncbi:Ig-like domain-containing protein [Parendozoicomonas sp. Alg238-R29]|uniref:Ig-like domain-containing protein n=1 Tax=Parendozoicomonas sp. Alg238-R29 TaxID=2993446 RepID=UPI00248E24F7|nr:Ig-like domain-containing protein [Parendozoicomonas sp. Alg238-R29]